MGRQIIHRLVISFPALVGVLFLCFVMMQVAPADPAQIIAGPDAKQETIDAIRLELGLDRPIIVQFIEYIGRVIQGDLGRSIISNKAVSEELAQTIGPPLELMVGGSHGAFLPKQLELGPLELGGQRAGLGGGGALKGLHQGLDHQLQAHVDIVVLGLGKALAKGLVERV